MFNLFKMFKGRDCEPASMNQTIRFCTTLDDVQLAYAVSGEGLPLG
jgi:hypothetical protein